MFLLGDSISFAHFHYNDLCLLIRSYLKHKYTEALISNCCVFVMSSQHLSNNETSPYASVQILCRNRHKITVQRRLSMSSQYVHYIHACNNNSAVNTKSQNRCLESNATLTGFAAASYSLLQENTHISPLHCISKKYINQPLTISTVVVLI